MMSAEPDADEDSPARPRSDWATVQEAAAHLAGGKTALDGAIEPRLVLRAAKFLSRWDLPCLSAYPDFRTDRSRGVSESAGSRFGGRP